VSAAAHDRRMEKQGRVADVEALIREIQRYLAVVNAFRASGSKSGKARRKEKG